MIDRNYGQINNAKSKRARISAVPAAIGLALALVLIADTTSSHGGARFLGMPPQQVGRSFGIASVILFFAAFGIGYRQKSSLTTGLLIGGGVLYLVFLIVGTIRMTVLFYYGDPNTFYLFSALSCIVLGLGLVRLFKRNSGSTVKESDGK